MGFNFLNNLILINIDGDQFAFNSIQNFSKKSFERAVYLQNTIIIFHSEKEKSKKRFFLDWVYNYFKRKGISFGYNDTQSLKNSFNHTLKIRLVNRTQIIQNSTIYLKPINQNMVGIKLNGDSISIGNFFKSIFKSEIKDTHKYYDFLIDIGSNITLHNLKKIVERKRILNISVIFIIEQTLKERLLNSVETIENSVDNSKYYQVLSVSDSDDISIIRRKYISLVKEYHPDKVFNKDEETIRFYTEKFQEIQEAFEFFKKELREI